MTTKANLIKDLKDAGVPAVVGYSVSTIENTYSKATLQAWWDEFVAEKPEVHVNYAGTVITTTHPYASVTRTVYALTNGKSVTVDVNADGSDGRISLAQGNLGLLDFDHHNPVGAAVTLVQVIEAALATTMEV